jgi:hypothetical protein
MYLGQDRRDGVEGSLVPGLAGRDQRVIAAETDKLTERALATFGPAEREALIRALAAIRQNLAV